MKGVLRMKDSIRLVNLPMSALLAGETIQVIDVRPGLHNHLERRYLLVASRAMSRIPEQPEVVPFTEDKVGPGEQTRTDLS